MKKHTIYKSEKGKELIKSHYNSYVGSMNLVYAPDTIGHPGYSEEVRVSSKDESMAFWLLDLMESEIGTRHAKVDYPG